MEWQERTPPPLPADKLRFVSINLCCLPPGLRNHDLPYFTTSSGVFLFVLLILPSVLLSFLLGNWKVGVGIFVPLVVLCQQISHIFGCEFARVRGMLMECLDPMHSDRKKERLDAAFHFIKDYDVVFVQELFDTRVMNAAKHVDYFVAKAKEIAGLAHVCRPSGAYLPSVTMNMGLLILSRFPIVSSSELKFPYQFLGDKFAVNRGCLHARLEVPVLSPSSFTLRRSSPPPPSSLCPAHRALSNVSGGGPSSPAADASTSARLLVDVFTCHISPAMDTLTGTSDSSSAYSTWLVNLGERARQSQIRSYSNFIRAKALPPGSGSMLVSMGDYNADINHNVSKNDTNLPTFKIGAAMKAVQGEMTALGLVDMLDGRWMPTFGYPGLENLLTNVDSRQKSITEDLGWVDEWTARHSAARAVSMEMKKNLADAGESKYVSFDDLAKKAKEVSSNLTHMSDHWALELIVTDVESAGLGGGASATFEAGAGEGQVGDEVTGVAKPEESSATIKKVEQGNQL